MKKYRLIFLIFIIVHQLFADISSIKISNTYAVENDSVYISIIGENLNDMGALTLFLNIDTTKIKWDKTLSTNEYMTGSLAGLRDSTIIIAWSNLNGVSFISDTLYSLSFKYLGSNTDLEFDTCKSEISETNGIPLNVEYTNGYIFTLPIPQKCQPIIDQEIELYNPDSVLFNWQSLEFADYYELKIAKDVDITQDLLKYEQLEDTSLVFKDFSDGSVYYWSICGINRAGYGEFSDTLEIKTKLYKPTELNITNNQVGKVSLTWIDNSSNEDGFLLYRNSSDNEQFSLVDSIQKNTTEYLDVSATDTVEYEYYICCFNEICTSDSSNHTSVSTITDVENEIKIVNEYNLYQNYPNPFNPTTIIKYYIPKNSFVNIDIYNCAGDKIEELVNSKQNSGYHQITWNTKDLPSGIYIYKIQSGDFMDYKKCMLIK